MNPPLNRRRFRKSTIVLAALAALPCALKQAVAEAGMEVTRPNIIHFMSDDHGWGHTGYDGHPVIKTPNLDAMATAGLRLDRFYVACPKCSPTRYSVITGVHPLRYGFLNGAGGGPFRSAKTPDRTIAEVAAEAGYMTAHFGKWHLGPLGLDMPTNPSRRGFQYWRTSPGAVEPQDPVLVGEDGKEHQAKGNGSEAIVAEALKFIRDAAKQDKPFLVVIWTSDPHGPYDPPSEIVAMYDRKQRSGYAFEITAMDRALGMLRDGLRDLEVAENTLLWFNSDNGWSGSDRVPPLRGGKTTCWEGGIRVPAVIEWPARIKPGSHSSVPVSCMDLMPTLGSLVGARDLKMRVPVDGIDLLPLFDCKMTKRPRPIPFAWFGQVGLIDNRYKICRGDPGSKRPQPDQWHLYDIEQDPVEEYNLAAEKPELLEHLRKDLNAWLQWE